MNKLCKTARGLDVFFKIMSWVFAALAVLLVIAAIAIPFGNAVTGQKLGSYILGYNGINVPFNAEGTEALAFIKDARLAFFTAAIVLLVGMAFAWAAIRIIRQILKPMKEGKPFETVVSSKLRTLGILTIVYGVVGIIVNAVGQNILLRALQGVKGEMFTLSVSRSYNMSFILIAAVLFLFSYVFRYGEELQKQSDETL